MDAPASDSPSLPNERSASPAAWQAGCIIACGLALLPILYVGSFAYLFADSLNEWGFCESLDEGTLAALETFYWPLIWLCNSFLG